MHNTFASTSIYDIDQPDILLKSVSNKPNYCFVSLGTMNWQIYSQKWWSTQIHVQTA